MKVPPPPKVKTEIAGSRRSAAPYLMWTACWKVGRLTHGIRGWLIAPTAR